jgi:hypothetical protein
LLHYSRLSASIPKGYVVLVILQYIYIAHSSFLSTYGDLGW